ncbi:hypothetical protein GGF46_001574 [Coemansia sp. RSA 552]|nr:hypothetical protein GGF46_001574 [Coemansia sp. RSA 552]
MAGILLESAIVLVPLGCGALYIVVMSNRLLVSFLLALGVVAFAMFRLRYHYSAGARSDLVVRSKTPEAPSRPRRSGQGDSADDSAASDRESDAFDEIIQDARQHRDTGDEVVERSGGLLSDIVTPESTRYDMELYGPTLAYDHRCFYIGGQPTWVLATDFDYWRLPTAALGAMDSEQPSPKSSSQRDAAVDTWRRMLLQVKALGFNTVRIRFHWGFHSPSKGTYDFTGGRNVDLLLSLCEELGILVIACLGPYIGDDLQGGGFPFWLIQRDHIRLRHIWRAGVKIWDDQFAAAESEWYDKIVPMLVAHEVVTKNARGHGCVMMVQLDNHLSARGALGLPLALHDETRLLARMARERILRTPLVTNNLDYPRDFLTLPVRLWARIERKLRAYRLIKAPYRPDIPGFSAQNISGTPVDIDSVARATRDDNAPMLALELHASSGTQGRQFCDQIESALSQGLSAFSLPGFLGLGARGNFASPQLAQLGGDRHPAVSQDGVLSADARMARQVLSLARALEPLLAASDPAGSRPWISRVSHPAVRGLRINKVPSSSIHIRRQRERLEPAVAAPSPSSARSGKASSDADENAELGLVAFVDGRDLPTKEKCELAFLYSLADAPIMGDASSFALTGTLGPRGRGIFAANITVGEHASKDPLVLTASSKEIYARVATGAGSEAWICAEESIQSGQLFFCGECQVSGHAEVEVVDVEHAKGRRFSFVIPKPGTGMARVTGPGGISVLVLFVSSHALDTLTVSYGSYDRDKPKSKEPRTQEATAASAVWGADGVALGCQGNIELLSAVPSTDSQIVVVSQKQPLLDGRVAKALSRAGNEADPAFSGEASVWQFAALESNPSSVATVESFERRTTSWNDLPWKLLPTMADLETMDEINVLAWQRDLGTFAYKASDLGFNGSHVLYRCQVRLKPRHITSRKIRLQLNARHRCTVWTNGINMSGHQTFHELAAEPGTAAARMEALRNPGSASGADRWGGTVTYDVTSAMRLSGAEEEEGALNEVVVVVESFGVGAQANGENDAHTPRGLISAYWHGFNFVGEDHDDSEIHDHEHDQRTEQMRAKWEICGVDVTKLRDSYNSSGFPDETTRAGWTAAIEHPLASPEWSTRVQLGADTGVQWLRWQVPPTSTEVGVPVHLRVCGKATVYIWINDILVAKHYPHLPESRVLVRGGPSAPGSQASADQVKLMAYGWAEDADSSSTAAGANGRPAINLELSLLSSNPGSMG